MAPQTPINANSPPASRHRGRSRPRKVRHTKRTQSHFRTPAAPPPSRTAAPSLGCTTRFGSEPKKSFIYNKTSLFREPNEPKEPKEPKPVPADYKRPAKTKVPLEEGAQRLIIATCEKGTVENIEEMRGIKGGLHKIKKANPNFVEIAAKQVFRVPDIPNQADPLPKFQITAPELQITRSPPAGDDIWSRGEAWSQREPPSKRSHRDPRSQAQA